MTKMYEKACQGCAAEFVDEPVSLNDFMERCPRGGTDYQRQYRWERALRRGGNCALIQTVEVADSTGEQPSASTTA